MIFKPTLFDKFKCIADRCTDTCCAGWEICVDNDTADLYRSLGGEVGEFIRQNVTFRRSAECDDGDMLLCREGERCRFLDSDGLCTIIKRLGDEALCDICREHPRFYAYSDDGGVCLAGVGLCCEAAAALWLSDSPIEFVFEDDGYDASADELAKLDELKRLIAELQNEESPLYERFSRLFGMDSCICDTELYHELRLLYASLDALSDDYAERFSIEPPSVGTADERRYANLAVYYVFRYFYDIDDCGLLLRFAAANVIMTAAMNGSIYLAAKDFSKEVEYDTDNVSRVLEFLADVDNARIIGLITAIFSKNQLDKH
ncbi:MAG: hypothetical protein HFE63_02735 [Clostridiales bacterium]|nr:hypothetical protein [Clostridiales bacterium]